MKKIYLLILIATALSACEKREVAEPTLDIALPKTTYAVNEPVIFSFEGDADIVTFFSGVLGSEFKHRDRLTVAGIPQASFTTNRSVAFPTGTDNSLKFLASTDFNGILTNDNIATATWTDLTGKGTISRVVADTQFGTIDLSDVAQTGKPVYFAFKTSWTKSAIAQPTWTIKSFSLDVQTEAGPPVKKASVKNMANLTWASWSVANPAVVWVAPSPTQLVSTGAAANADDNEDWLISQAVDLKTVSRDLGVNVKTNVRAKLNSYTFTGYATAGTYNVTFEVINANRFGEKSYLKEFVITVQ